MIDTTEKLIRLSDVPSLSWLPRRRKGAKLAANTVHRWATNGLKGVTLETVSVGACRCTSEAALLRFFERTSAPQPRQSDPTPSQRRKQQERAKAILKAAGI